jgi:hypothetical protein
MPTGSKHVHSWEDMAGVHHEEDCRCTLGEDHNDSDFSVGDADEIWDSSGHDEDYDFR